ncbi:MAG: NlpC/P60 family protein [Armatimonadota bacterium]
MTNPMDFSPIKQNKIPDEAQPFFRKQAEPKPDMLAFSDQLQQYIEKTTPQNMPTPLTETEKLDQYIAMQAQKIYEQTGDFKPQVIKIQPLDESKSTESTQKIEKVDSEKANQFHNLKLGSTGKEVKDLQKMLIKWHPKMRRFIQVNGVYNQRTAKAVALFQSIYGIEPSGNQIDLQTSKLITGVKDGTFWKFDPVKSDQYHPEKTVSGKILYTALCDLGKPYHLGGDGEYTTDCAMLTRRALIGSEAISNSFKADPSTRLADIQYMHAEQGKNNMTLVKDPKPGDLIFFKNTSYQSGIAYKRVTHVAIYVDKNTMLAASPSHGGVTLQNTNEIHSSKIAGYGRLQPQASTFAATEGPQMEGI